MAGGTPAQRLSNFTTGGNVIPAELEAVFNVTELFISIIGLVQEPGWFFAKLRLAYKSRGFGVFFAKIRQIYRFLAEVVQ